MGAILALVFIVVPILELAVIIKVGAAVGVLETVALLVISSLVGSWLVKREGLGVLRRMRVAVGERRVPGHELVDAFLIMLGGALMLVPGFITDVVGLLLLLPPVRAVVRRGLRRRYTTRMLGPGSSGVIDL